MDRLDAPTIMSIVIRKAPSTSSTTAAANIPIADTYQSIPANPAYEAKQSLCVSTVIQIFHLEITISNVLNFVNL